MGKDASRSDPTPRIGRIGWANVLWKFAPDANFVLGLAVVSIRRSEACEVRHRFNVPREHVWHVRRLTYIAA